MLSVIRIFKQIPLVRRIALIALICAAILTGLTLFVSYLIQFEKTKQVLTDCVTDRIDHYYPEFGESIWSEEADEIGKLFLLVEKECGSKVGQPAKYFWQLSVRDDPSWFSKGDNLVRWPTVDFLFPISYWEGKGVGQYGIGELFIKVSLREYYDDLAFQAWLIYAVLLVVLMFSCALAMALGYKWFVATSQDFIEKALTGNVDQGLREHIENERTEITKLWEVILRLRNDFQSELKDSQSELHQLRQELASVESDVASKRQMVATLSHELRTPMNGLISFTSLLAETNLQQEQREYVETIQASLESLLYVINDVSDLANFEAGELQVDNIPFCIRSVMSGISSLLRAKAESKGLLVETRVDPKVPGCLLGDPARIRKLLSKLVFNAIEYTEVGLILVNIDAVSEKNNVCQLRLSVEDSGVPLEKRWPPLASLDSHGAVDEADGYGQDTTDRLAQQLNSEIHYRSEMLDGGGGVSAWIDLQFIVSPALSGQQMIDRSALSLIQLVVLDNSDLSRKITLELVDEWGVPVFAKESISEVLKFIPLCIEDRHTVVLLDDSIENYDPLTAVSQLRSLMLNSGSIVVMSGSPSVGDGERFFAAGANGYLVKSDRDLYLKDIICQVYAERDFSVGKNKRLITRYTVGVQDNGFASLGKSYRRALLVESSIVNQQFLARELEKKGCLIDIATNGFEALELFKHHSYDLIILDCWLEDMDGYETAQLFRDLEASRKTGCSASIIGLSKDVGASEYERCSRAGMDEVLQKPINLSHLDVVLTQYLD